MSRVSSYLEIGADRHENDVDNSISNAERHAIAQYDFFTGSPKTIDIKYYITVRAGKCRVVSLIRITVENGNLKMLKAYSFFDNTLKYKKSTST